MDSKITKRRLSIALSYDWIKIVAIIVAISFFWMLAYTVGAPRASTGQQFQYFICKDFNAVDCDALLAEMSDNGVFSYDILDLSSRTMDVDNFGTIMSTISGASEGDVMIISDYEADRKENKSRFRSFIDTYGGGLFDVDSIISSAKNYCQSKGFVYFDENGSACLNSKKISDYFAVRMRKDPRFRDENSHRYQQGIADEINRIKLIWNNANMLAQCLNAHPDMRVQYVRGEQNYLNNEKDEELKAFYEKQELKTWGINLGALTDGANKITEIYAKNVFDENGNLIDVTANGIVFCFFSYIDEQPDLVYESIQCVNYLIKNYSNFLDGEFQNLIA